MVFTRVAAAWSAAAAAAALLAAPTAAQDWTSLTLYDILQEDCRTELGDKDLGDPAGDAFFMLKDVYLPVACEACKKTLRGCNTPSTFDCGNPESEGNRVVRKVQLDVMQDWGSYQLCNQKSTSSCDYQCFSLTRNPKPGVGNQAVCAGDPHECDMAPPPSTSKFHPSPQWDFWNYNTAALMGKLGPQATQATGDDDTTSKATTTTTTTGNGQWYSFLAKDEEKYWRNATIVKTINAECHWHWVAQKVEQTGQACFDACPGTSGTNTSSACYVNCFFDTFVGVGSGNTTSPVGGMEPSVLTTAWLSAFESDDPSTGGCPPCPATGDCPPPSWLKAA